MDDGREVLLVSGSTVSVGESTNSLLVEYDDDELIVRVDGNARPLELRSGRLGGLLEAANENIPATQARLSDLVATIVRSVDQQYATGLTDAGAFQVIKGSRGVRCRQRSPGQQRAGISCDTRRSYYYRDRHGWPSNVAPSCN